MQASEGKFGGGGGRIFTRGEEKRRKGRGVRARTVSAGAMTVCGEPVDLIETCDITDVRTQPATEENGRAKRTNRDAGRRGRKGALCGRPSQHEDGETPGAGEQRAESGERRADSGQRRAESGRRRAESGERFGAALRGVRRSGGVARGAQCGGGGTTRAARNQGTVELTTNGGWMSRATQSPTAWAVGSLLAGANDRRRRTAGGLSGWPADRRAATVGRPGRRTSG